MTDLADLLFYIRKDLQAVLTGVLWAEGLAYSKPGRGLDSPRGVSLAKDEDEQDAGPRYDLALGDHPARAALHNVPGRLARVEVRMNGAWLACGQTRQVLTSSSMVVAGEMWTVATMEASLTVIARLCALVENDYQAVQDAMTKRRVFKAVGQASEQLGDAVAGLERALNRGQVSQPSMPPCRNGPHAPASPKQADNRCEACAQWYRRNGYERPVHRMTEPEDREPRKQKNKRVANGIGHGDESFSWALRRLGD